MAADGLGFVDRKNESRRLAKAIVERQSLMVSGPAGIGKTALVSQVIAGLPAGLARRCLGVQGPEDLQDLLRMLVRRLYEAEDVLLRRQLHSEGVSTRTFGAWLKGLSTSRLKGALYRMLEGGDYRVILDHLPRLTEAMARVVKELFWMRNTPVYLVLRDEDQQRINWLCRFFYWGAQERLTLQPLPTPAAAVLTATCLQRSQISQPEPAGLRAQVLKLSKRVPGAIIDLCALAADPRYQCESGIKIRSAYLSYLTKGQMRDLPPSKSPNMNRPAARA